MAEETKKGPAPVRGKTQVAVREVGYVSTGAADYWGIDPREKNPDLRWPNSIEIYDRMRREDSQVVSVLRAVTHPVRRTPWRIDPAGARPEVVDHVATDLGLPVRGQSETTSLRTRDRFSWPQHLQMALLMLPFGHSIFEQVYRIDEETGLARLRKLGPRMPETIAKWNVARDGGLVSVEQYAAAASTATITIPVSRLVVYVHEREGAEWWGQSLLRSAYKPWLLKDRMLRVGAQAVDRNGLGVPVYEGAETDNSPEKLDAGAEIAQAIRAGDNSGAALPNGAKLRLLGVEGQTVDGMPWVKYYDDQIARSVLAHFLNLGGSRGTGSWALGTTFADFFTQSLQAIGEHIADVANQHIIEDLVDINYGVTEPAPRLVFDEIGSKTASIAGAMKMLVDAGVITPDGNLEKYIRDGLGLPSAEDQDAGQ